VADLATLPTDVPTLHRMIVALSTELDDVRKKFTQVDRELAYLRSRTHGPKSEKLTADQLTLGFAIRSFPITPPPPIPPPLTGRNPGHGRRKQPKLPVERTIIDLPEERKVCDDCGGKLGCIGEEISHRAEFRPGHFFIQEDVRPKYACSCSGVGVLTAPPRIQVVEKGLAGPGLLAYVVVAKYADHLPLYRQSRIFARHGLDLSRSTLCAWVARAADLLAPIYLAMKLDVLASKVIQTDDTTVRLLEAKEEPRCGRIWAYLGDLLHRQTVYDFSRTREGKHVRAFLGDFRGAVQADAFSGYDGLYEGGRVVELACWAHCRRYFHDAKVADSTRALAALAFIHQLYEIEDQGKKLSADERKILRQRLAAPVLAEFEKWIKDQSILPKSPIGEAIGYALNQWTALNRYLEDGDYSIDNNGAERALRKVAVGRRNYLFFATETGGDRAAILYSIIESCGQSGVEPFAYLRDVLERVATHPAREVHLLMPRLWKPATLTGPPSEAPPS
jgi:transposase